MKKIMSLISAFILMIGFAGCSDNKTTETLATDKVNITVTTTFLLDLVQQIGGDHVEVIGLMGAGVDPHQYQASNSDLAKLQEADLVFYNGVHLEAKLASVLSKMGDNVIDTSHNIPKSELLYSEDLTEAEIAEIQAKNGDDHDEIYDPHIWFDVNLWKIVAQDVAATLSKVDTKNSSDYQAELTTYLKELTDLEGYVKTKISSIPAESRYLITAHDAFNYFSRFTGMEVRGIQGVNTNTEASTNDVIETANFIVEHKIKAIFVETSVSSKLVEALQESVRSKGFEVEIGGEIYSDATGDAGTTEATYIGMYKANVDTIYEALR